MRGASADDAMNPHERHALSRRDESRMYCSTLSSAWLKPVAASYRAASIGEHCRPANRLRAHADFCVLARRSVTVAARAAPAARSRRRGAVRRRLARPLLHRCLDLPDRAGRRRRAAQRRGGAHRGADRGRKRDADPAARRRHFAVRADRRRGAGHRQQQAPERASSSSTPASRAQSVQPGIVLDQLNAVLRPHGLWFPVDVSTSAQATIGGMTGNNSCGSRSIAYGNMVHNVLAVDALARDRRALPLRPDRRRSGGGGLVRRLSRPRRFLRALYEREKDEIEARFPKVLRRVAGYNLDHLGPPHANVAHLLVGTEGTLAYFERVHLKLSPLPQNTRARRLPFRELLHGDGIGAAHRQARSDRGRAGRSHDDRSGARERRVSRDRRALRRRRPDAILLVEFAGEDKTAQAAAPAAARPS